MAELNVQPKKKTNILAWLLLLAGIAALIWWLTRDKNGEVATIPPEDTITNNATTSTTTPTADWNSIDFNSPTVSYDEITDKNIDVRGNNSYGIYGLGENVLFDEGKATIRTDAEANLKQITGSIDKRYNGGEVRIYGYTDSTGSAGANKELAQQRADAVKNWLQSNGIDAGRISVNAIGEARPIATNSTEAGRQQNRRVEIVARTSNAQ
jgi:outer membrane protein OmpA-like peptidoglycan-associated protein